jgi:cell division GTPase FtsZ
MPNFGDTGWRPKRPNQETDVPSKDDELEKSLNAAAGKPKLGGITPPKKPGGIANVAKSMNPSSHKAAAKPTVIKDEFDYDTAMHMAFVGAGQGGGKIAQAFWELGYRRVGAFNTTENDFAGLAPEMPKYSTHTSGAAKDMELARQAINGRDEDIWDLYQRAWGSQFDCVLVCASLGGGTGSGTVLPLVKLARKYMEAQKQPVRVGAVVSLPFVTEGQQVARNAVRAFRELVAEGVSPLIVIDNDRVDEVYTPVMRELLPKSNECVSQLFHTFNRLAATKSEHITFDRAEFAQLLDAGIVAMGSAEIDVANVRSPADVSSAIRDQLANSVLAQVDLRTGKKACCLFVSSDDVLNTFGRAHFDAGFTQLNRIVGQGHPEGTEVIIHRGLYPLADDGLQCYTMVADLAPPETKLKALAKEAGVREVAQPGSVARHLKVD